MKPATFIFIGRSGCGKGTQAKLLIDYLKTKNSDQEIFYLETGQKFRDFMQGNTYTQKLAREIAKVGGLQPAFLAVHMWSHEFIANLGGGEHLIIDGTPRMLREAKVLDTALKFYHRLPTNIIYVNVSREWAAQRLGERKREDDGADSVDNRMRWFDDEVTRSVEWYRTNPDYKFLDINGERPIDEIHKDIIRNINLA